MHIREIPRAQWREYLDSFSRTYRGWLSTLETTAAGTDAQVHVREQPLAGITLEKSGEVSLLIGREPEAHVGHTIHAAASIRASESGDGACEALEIESADGTITQLRFRSAIAPQLVDGVFLE